MEKPDTVLPVGGKIEKHFSNTALLVSPVKVVAYSPPLMWLTTLYQYHKEQTFGIKVIGKLCVRVAIIVRLEKKVRLRVEGSCFLNLVQLYCVMLSGNRIFDLAGKYTNSPASAIILVLLILLFRLLFKFGFFIVITVIAREYVEVDSSTVAIALFCTIVSSAYGVIFGGIGNREK